MSTVQRATQQVLELQPFGSHYRNEKTPRLSKTPRKLNPEWHRENPEDPVVGTKGTEKTMSGPEICTEGTEGALRDPEVNTEGTDFF